MNIGERKQKILQAVVCSYVDTAEPVGSSDLASRYADWGVKAATIRNELADLSEQGYLRQPHTSSGRIPSDLGYRFYVDNLRSDMPIQGEEASRSRSELEADRAETLDRMLRQTCALLTQMTRYTAIATPPRPSDTQLRQIFTTPAGPDTLLVVGLLSTSETENRFITGDVARMAIADPSALVEATNAVNSAWTGKSLDWLATIKDDQVEPPRDLRHATARALYKVIAETTRLLAKSATSGDRTVIEGTNEILRQPEFQDVAKIEAFLDTMQSQATVFACLLGSLDSKVTVVIGSENRLEALQECSVITAPYFVGTRERGTLGVVGPTRMNYDRAMPAVEFMAQTLSDLLNHLI
jgi:heat-inducible transcriptional repressor